MSTLSLPQSGARAPAALVASVFAKDVKLVDGTELAVEGAAQEKGLVAVLSQLLKQSSADSKPFGVTQAEESEVKQWLTKVEQGTLKTEELDAHLKTRTYLVSNHLTAADLAVFASIHPSLSTSSRQTLLSHPSLTRHFDLIQHLPSVASTLSSPSAANVLALQPAKVDIDLDDVPRVERIAPVKEKKEKKPAAAVAASTAASGAAESKPAKGGKDGNDAQEAKVAKEPKVKQSKADASAAASTSAPSKKAEKEKAPPAAASSTGPPAPWMVDLRVGKIIDVQKHPDADSLYVETIDFGEKETRTVVSGLVNYVPIEEMRDRLLVGVCNLKPVAMRGIKSFAMVLCATSPSGKEGGIELVLPPPSSVPGDRLHFEGFEAETPLEQLNPKKKIWEAVQPGFITLDTKECAWVDKEGSGQVRRIRNEKGVVTCKSFVGASLS